MATVDGLHYMARQKKHLIANVILPANQGLPTDPRDLPQGVTFVGELTGPTTDIPRVPDKATPMGIAVAVPSDDDVEAEEARGAKAFTEMVRTSGKVEAAATAAKAKASGKASNPKGAKRTQVDDEPPPPSTATGEKEPPPPNPNDSTALVQLPTNEPGAGGEGQDGTGEPGPDEFDPELVDNPNR